MDSPRSPYLLHTRPCSCAICVLLSVVALLSLLGCRSAAPRYTRIWEAAYFPPSSGFALPGAMDGRGEAVLVTLHESAEDLVLMAMFTVSRWDTDGSFVDSDWEPLVTRVKCGDWGSGPLGTPALSVTMLGRSRQCTYVLDIIIPKGMKDDPLKRGVLEMRTSRIFRLAFPNLPGAAPQESCDGRDLPLVYGGPGFSDHRLK